MTTGEARAKAVMGTANGARNGMMTINMFGLSEQEMERAVVQLCSTYGTVRKLRIYLPRSDSIARPFALVDMATHDEAARLADAMGRITMDCSVVVFLAQERDRLGVLTRAR